MVKLVENQNAFYIWYCYLYEKLTDNCKLRRERILCVKLIAFQHYQRSKEIKFAFKNFNNFGTMFPSLDIIIVLPCKQPDNVAANYHSRLGQVPSEELQGVMHVFMNWQRDAFVTVCLVKLYISLSSRRLMNSRINISLGFGFTMKFKYT